MNGSAREAHPGPIGISLVIGLAKETQQHAMKRGKGDHRGRDAAEGNAALLDLVEMSVDIPSLRVLRDW